MTLECPECGSVVQSKGWQDCGDKHQAVGMYQVLDWGRLGKQILTIGNKGIAEEKFLESGKFEEIVLDVTQDTGEA